MNWFADKLGPLPDGMRGAPAGGLEVDSRTGRPVETQAPAAPKPAAAPASQPAPQPAPQAAAPRPAPQPEPPPPEPEPKKKKGWFG